VEIRLDNIRFGFENLEVWKKAVEFAKEAIDLAEEIESERKHFRLVEQLEAAATSVALNIAEGKGRYSKKEFIQYLHIARGSLNETITLLIIFHEKGWIHTEKLSQIKMLGDELGKKISSLITSIRRSMREYDKS